MLVFRVVLIVAAAIAVQSCRVNKKETVNLEGMWRLTSEKVLNVESLPNGVLVDNHQHFIIDSMHFTDRRYTFYGIGFVEHGDYHLNSEQQLHLSMREGSDLKEPSEVLDDLTIDLLTLKSKKISFSRSMTFKFPDSKDYQVDVIGIFKRR